MVKVTLFRQILWRWKIKPYCSLPSNSIVWLGFRLGLSGGCPKHRSTFIKINIHRKPFWASNIESLRHSSCILAMKHLTLRVKCTTILKLILIFFFNIYQKALFKLNPELMSSVSECWQLRTSLWDNKFITSDGEPPLQQKEKRKIKDCSDKDDFWGDGVRRSTNTDDEWMNKIYFTSIQVNMDS